MNGNGKYLDGDEVGTTRLGIAGSHGEEFINYLNFFVVPTVCKNRKN